MGVRTASGFPGGDYDLQNPVGSFVDVVRRVVTQPVAFFSGIPRRGNLQAPLTFALICIEISTILGGLLRLTWRAETAGGFRFQEGVEYGFGDFVLSVLLAPIVGAIGLAILAVIAHVLVILFVGTSGSGFGSAFSSGFESTFRIVCYVSVTNLVNWIPLIGGLLALYGLYLAVIGVREMHDTTTGRAALVVLFPLAVLLLLTLLILLLVGAFLLGRFV